MGISIKNVEVEKLVRHYADATGLGVTEAVAHAVRTASEIERRERAEKTKREAVQRFLEIAAEGWTSSGERWTRDELHER